MKIALIGPYPPPYGGISIHIKRLAALLIIHGYEVDVFPNLSVRRWLISARGKWFSYDILHFHDIPWKNRVLIGFLGFVGFKVILTIHGESLENQFSQARRLKKLILGFGVRNISHIIAVNTKIRDLLLSININSINISVIPAFLPPQPLRQDFETIPSYVWTFISRHTPIISGNAYQMTFNHGEDLYGIDMCVKACISLITDYPNLGFVIFISSIGDEDYLASLQDQIQKANIQNNFLFVIREDIEFYPILTKSDVFVRPTNTDGDAVSIREAIYNGVPVVASDIVIRPKGVILFKNRDRIDFIKKIKQAIDMPQSIKRGTDDHNFINKYIDIIDIYRKMV